MKLFTFLAQGKAALFSIGLLLFSQIAATSEQLLFSAIQKNDLAKVTQALKSTQAINSVNASGDTPLLLAARSGNLAIMDLLLEQGANINQLDSSKRDILNIAISHKNPELVRWALDHQIDPTMVTSVYEGSALIYACHQGQVDIVNMLIKAGTPLDRVNNLGWTALLETTVLGDGSYAYQQITRLLVDAGANRNIKDRNGKTPLDHARQRGHHEIVKILQ